MSETPGKPEISMHSQESESDDDLVNYEGAGEGLDLTAIEESLIQLQNDCRDSQRDIKTLDLASFFNSLHERITRDNLDTAARILGVGCDLLEEKVRRIQVFIQLLDNPDKILSYFTNYFDYGTSAQFIDPHWLRSPIITGLSVAFLSRSLERLSALRRPSLVLTPPEISNPPTEFSINLPEKRFEELKIEILQEITSQGCPSLAKILQSRESAEKYYETFMIILHLIQDGRVRYFSQTQSLVVANHE